LGTARSPRDFLEQALANLEANQNRRIEMDRANAERLRGDLLTQDLVRRENNAADEDARQRLAREIENPLGEIDPDVGRGLFETMRKMGKITRREGAESFIAPSELPYGGGWAPGGSEFVRAGGRTFLRKPSATLDYYLNAPDEPLKTFNVPPGGRMVAIRPTTGEKALDLYNPRVTDQAYSTAKEAWDQIDGGEGFSRDTHTVTQDRNGTFRIVPKRIDTADALAELLAGLEGGGTGGPAVRKPAPKPGSGLSPSALSAGKTESQLRAEAQAAIEQGADRAKVGARFKQLTGKDL
jgi:hypothetical protein